MPSSTKGLRWGVGRGVSEKGRRARQTEGYTMPRPRRPVHHCQRCGSELPTMYTSAKEYEWCSGDPCPDPRGVWHVLFCEACRKESEDLQRRMAGGETLPLYHHQQVATKMPRCPHCRVRCCEPLAVVIPVVQAWHMNTEFRRHIFRCLRCGSSVILRESRAGQLKRMRKVTQPTAMRKVEA